MSAQFDKLLRLLARGHVEFILIGGVAGNIHGSARLTFDVDIVYERNKANIERLAQVLKPHAPYLRGAPAGLPFSFDERTIRSEWNVPTRGLSIMPDMVPEQPGHGH
jgi:hypothetical protein